MRGLNLLKQRQCIANGADDKGQINPNPNPVAGVYVLLCRMQFLPGAAFIFWHFSAFVVRPVFLLGILAIDNEMIANRVIFVSSLKDDDQMTKHR